MILLLGGTSETGPIARRLAEAGYAVLVSTATDEPLDIGNLGCPGVRRRVGRLDAGAMLAMIREQPVQAIVDASHPYAAALRTIAPAVAREAGIPYLSYLRPGLEIRLSDPKSEIHLAADHEQAARIAFSLAAGMGKSAVPQVSNLCHSVLLTTGSQNLAPYVRWARQSGLLVFVKLAVRVLPRADSIRACLAAGIAREFIIAAKGPFSVDQNRQHIRQFHAGVIVTKDSGQAGGVDAKLEAARQEDCQVVVVQRPVTPEPATTKGFDSFDDLIVAVRRLVAVRS